MTPRAGRAMGLIGVTGPRVLSCPPVQFSQAGSASLLGRPAERYEYLSAIMALAASAWQAYHVSRKVCRGAAQLLLPWWGFLDIEGTSCLIL